MARAGRIRDRVQYGLAMTTEQGAQRRRGSEQMPDGGGGFTTGPRSPTQQYSPRVLRIGAGRGANTKGSLSGSGQVSGQPFKPKAQSVKQPSRTVRGYRG